ncbi:MAG TPA: RiPP maturation radical SAM C-methyltransferase, partial [Longimicrobium sp.]|nr:RiPP maturation radical SAM C-methyltransferase [Longimicrobium sp.]
MIAGRRVDVCLVSMPYAALPRPSLALGLLKAVLEDAGLATVALYPNLWFAERVGIRRYHLCSAQTPTEFLTGEWTFAEAAFPGAPRDDEGYLRAVGGSAFRVQAYRGPDAATRLVTELRALREAASGFVDEAARRVLATGARIVGCTSTFEQHVPSLALLRRVRELDPSVITLLGGANCETVMGEATHRHFPAVDYLVSGEADGLIGDLCHDIMRRGRDIPPGELPAGVLGPRHRDPAEAREPLPRALFRDLNALPVPDFGDYFAALDGSALGEVVTPGLPLETSRGCWWGALHHCTFCGLNGSSMGYRSKAPDRVLSEVRELEQRYAISGFETVDNILDMGYFRSVLPELAGDGVPRRIFYEVKANLKRTQVK